MGPSTPGKTSPRNGTRERSLTGRTRLDLDLLRAFELRKDGVAVSLPPGSQRLVAFLALRDRPLGRVHVAGNLWLDVSDDRACANLRTAVWRLRQLDPGVIESSATHMRLSRTVAVDVHDTLAQARRLVDPSVTCEESDLVGDALLAELLPDWYDDWVLLEQERFRQLRLHALESLCSRLIATRRFAMAIEAGLAAVAAEPLRESAQRVLVRAYLEEGNAGEALRQFHGYRELVHSELGLEPSQLMNDLMATLPTATVSRAQP